MNTKTNTNLSIMLVSGFLVKLLALFYKVILVRLIGIKGISYYQYILPVIMLFMGFADFAFPESITKLVAENNAINKSNKNIIAKSILIGLIIDTIIILIMLIFIKKITPSVDMNLMYPIVLSTLIIPLVTINSIIKGYFQGMNMIKYVAISNMIEQITRIFSSISFLLVISNIIISISSIILSMIIGEGLSLIFSLFILRKKCTKLDFKDKCSKEILSLCIPSTINRSLYTVSNFLEPIIFTKSLLRLGYPKENIVISYGMITGYVIPLLIMFSFTSISVSHIFMPKMAKKYKENNINQFNEILKKGLKYSFLLGLIPTIFLLSYPNMIMNILYGNTIGIRYLIYMAPIFLLYYLEPILHSAIIVINKSNLSLLINFIICFIKLSSIYFLPLYFGIDGYTISILISILLTVFSYIYIIKKSTRLKFSLVKPLLYILINILFILLVKENFYYAILSIIIYLLLFKIFYFTDIKSVNDD